MIFKSVDAYVTRVQPIEHNSYVLLMFSMRPTDDLPDHPYIRNARDVAYDRSQLIDISSLHRDSSLLAYLP